MYVGYVRWVALQELMVECFLKSVDIFIRPLCIRIIPGMLLPFLTSVSPAPGTVIGHILGARKYL